jgi:hypothetical protein
MINGFGQKPGNYYNQGRAATLAWRNVMVVYSSGKMDNLSGLERVL